MISVGVGSHGRRLPGVLYTVNNESSTVAELERDERNLLCMECSAGGCADEVEAKGVGGCIGMWLAPELWRMVNWTAGLLRVVGTLEAGLLRVMGTWERANLVGGKLRDEGLSAPCWYRVCRLMRSLSGGDVTEAIAFVVLG